MDAIGAYPVIAQASTFFDTEMHESSYPASDMSSTYLYATLSNSSSSAKGSLKIPAESNLFPANTLISRITLPAFDITAGFSCSNVTNGYGYARLTGTAMSGTVQTQVKFTENGSYTIPELVFYTKLTDSSSLTTSIGVGSGYTSTGSSYSISVGMTVVIPAGYVRAVSYYLIT